MTRRHKTLICAAYLPELEGLGPEVGTLALGIGPVDAAAGMARALALHRPEKVLLIGSCGAFAGAGLHVGDLVVVDLALWVDRSPGMEVPEVVAREAEGTPWLLEAAASAAGARRVIAACAAGVTVTDEDAAEIAGRTGAAVEHMEAFAVYRTCAREGVAVAALLSVANRVGDGARREWRANARRAEAAAVAGVLRVLAELRA